jgi:hypothetical protein
MYVYLTLEEYNIGVLSLFSTFKLTPSDGNTSPDLGQVSLKVENKLKTPILYTSNVR